MTCANPQPCEEPDCPGWSWVNDSEVIACMGCARFRHNGYALLHVLTCQACRLALVAQIQDELHEDDAHAEAEREQEWEQAHAARGNDPHKG